MRRSLLGYALWLAIALSASGGLAQQESARELYDRGARAYREARYAEAIESFQRAHQLEPHAELAYNLGQAHEKLGDLTRAVASFREYLKLAPGADDRAVVQTRIENLEQRLQATLPRLGVTSTPAGARLEIDGKPAGTTPFVGALAAGEHELVLSIDGVRKTARKVVVGPSGTTELHVELEPARSPSAPAPDVEQPASRAASPSLPTWIAFGAGAGALGAALGFELARRGAEDDAESATTQLEHQARFSDAEGHRDRARVFAGIGAALVITGGVLLWMDLGDSNDQRAPTAGSVPPVRVGVGAVGDGGFGLAGATWF